MDLLMRARIDLWSNVRSDYSRPRPAPKVPGRINGLDFRLFLREGNDYGVVVVIGTGVVMIVLDPVPDAAALSAKPLVA